MGNIISIGLIEVGAIAGIVAAWFHGKITGTPRKDWRKGGLADGGYGAWKMPLLIVMIVSVAMVVFSGLIMKLTRWGSRMGSGGGYGGGGYGGGF